jgi:hypothetical protein
MYGMQLSKLLPAGLLLCAITGAAGCMKDELPVPAHVAGDEITAAVNMESDYRYQVYYSLEKNMEVGRNLKTSWDLGFETAADGYRVYLNGAKSMWAINTGKTDMAQVAIADTVGRTRQYDAPSGHADSTALGDWRTLTNVWVVDRGFDQAGVAQGVYKVKLVNVDASGYTLQIAPFDQIGAAVQTVQIGKDADYNLSFLSFTTGTQVTVEPPKETWDIAFSQYTHIFYDPFMPYLVSGCLLNRYNTSAAMEKKVPFASLTFSDVQNYQFSSLINTIGYDWKEYDFDKSKYTTYPNMNYLIRNSKGHYFKLHFIDFNDKNGVKGSPKWEFQQL